MATPTSAEQATVEAGVELGQATDLTVKDELPASRSVQIHVMQSSSDKTTTEEIAKKLKKPTITTGLIAFLIINTVMFFAGVTTTEKCPIQKMIPIYLAVAGAGGILIKIIPIVNRNRRLQVLDRITYLLFVFETIWMIAGSYWIYSIYKPNYNRQYGPYCDKTAYLIAFWLLTLHYIVLALFLLIPFLIAVCFCCFALIVTSD